jgi:F-type H+-transporting ATPase subunit c
MFFFLKLLCPSFMHKWIIFFIYFYEKNRFFFNFSYCCKIYGRGTSYYRCNWSCVGIGVVFAALLISFGRNPAQEKRLFQLAIFGFALCEAMGLLAVMMAFLILYVTI